MKRIRIYLIHLLYILSLAGVSSCTDQTEEAIDHSGQISIRLVAPGNLLTRTDEAGEDSWGENTLNRIDIFIFKSDGDLSFYQAYKNLGAIGNYTAVSNCAKTNFLASKTYDIYVIANFPDLQADALSAVQSVAQLQALTVTDGDIDKREGSDTRKGRFFLMDGVAKGKTLNDEKTAATVIEVSLKRAAAKIRVNLKCTKDFPTLNQLELTGCSGYRFMNFVTESSILNEAAPVNNPALSSRKSYTPVNNQELGYFEPGTEKENGCSFVAYTFANDWSGEGMDINNATYFIINLPYTKEKEDKNNYYKIPINYDPFADSDNSIDPEDAANPAKKKNCLQRNYLYEITAIVDKIGSEVEEAPVTITPEYEIEDWVEQEIPVEGGDDDASHARYLMVTENEVKMNNITEYQGIRYYASNNIRIGAVKITYINNQGVEQTITGSNYSDLGFGAYVLMQSLSYDQTTSPQGYISLIREAQNEVTNEENGYLEIVSKLLDLSNGNNSLLVKQFTFDVILDDGKEPEVKETISVTQYPVYYATQTQGWFSFKTPMSTSTSSSTTNWGAYKQCRLDTHRDGIGTVTNGTNGYNGIKNNGPFSSRVVRKYNAANGQSDLYTYGTYTTNSATWSNTGKDNSHTNAHIYHVHISTIPADKILGYPTITKDLNKDNTATNAKTISPFFMIASQLGVTSSGAGRTTAYTHCQNYVEVTYRYPTFNGTLNNANYSGGNVLSDWIVYSDWRLPTESEIEIIAQFQNAKGAVDIVLAGANYYALTGTNTESVKVPGNTGSSQFIRCVRDVKPGDPNYDN